MAEVVSIHRKEDLRHARLLAEHVRSKLRAPVSAVTERVVERLAEMLGEFRIDRQNDLARCRAEIAAAHAELNAEFARIRALLDAVTMLRQALAARG